MSHIPTHLVEHLHYDFINTKSFHLNLCKSHLLSPSSPSLSQVHHSCRAAYPGSFSTSLWLYCKGSFCTSEGGLMIA